MSREHARRAKLRKLANSVLYSRRHTFEILWAILSRDRVCHSALADYARPGPRKGSGLVDNFVSRVADRSADRKGRIQPPDRATCPAASACPAFPARSPSRFPFPFPHFGRIGTPPSWRFPEDCTNKQSSAAEMAT